MVTSPYRFVKNSGIIARYVKKSLHEALAREDHLEGNDNGP
jgi:hypothetical protein